MLSIDEKIQDALLEAAFITRWNKDKSSMYGVLSTIETIQLIDDVVDELDKAGLKIVQKDDCLS